MTVHLLSRAKISIWWAASFIFSNWSFLLLPADFSLGKGETRAQETLNWNEIFFMFCFIVTWQKTLLICLVYEMATIKTQTHIWWRRMAHTHSLHTAPDITRWEKDCYVFITNKRRWNSSWRQFKVDCSRCWWESSDKYKVINSLLYCSGASWRDTILR